jgi:dTDP-4-amino-4,6-dideoxygalactose transaminase
VSVRLSRSIVGAEEADAVRRVLLEDGYLGMGREVQSFEREIASFLGVAEDQVACVSSGTAALHLAVEAALEPGDEVLVQSLTFVSSYQAIHAAKAVAIPCEVREESVTIDLADAQRRITPKTRAIMPVHYASYPAQLREIYAFAKQHRLRVIEDAAHAFGCTVDGTMVGSRSDIACFSFDGIKNITSGEGGAVVSADSRVMQRVRDARLLGVERDTERRYAGERSWDFDVTRAGYRYHMSNLFAAVGRVQLRRLPAEFAPSRLALAARYRERLQGRAGLAPFETAPGVVPHIFPVRILGGRRDAVRAELQSQGIETGIHYKPNHLLTLFRRPGPPLPVTERLYEEIISLPLHPGLQPSDADAVCEALARACSGT